MIAQAVRGLRALFVALIAAGCGQSPEGAPKQDLPVPVEVVRVAEGQAPGAFTVPARVKAREEVTLTAAGSAQLTALPFAEGVRFGAGAILARFDAVESSDALEAATASRAAAEVLLLSARRQEARMDSLFEVRVVSQREVDLARADARAAEASAATTRAALERQRSASAIIAPYDGVVVRHRADAGTRLTAGAPVLDIRTEGVGEIEVPLPESMVETLRRARVSVSVAEGPWRPARIMRLDGMIDPATRTRTAHLALERMAPEAEPGAYARAKFEQPAAGALGSVPTPTAAGPSGALSVTIPTSALVRRGSLTGVYVIHNGRASLRWIKPGRLSDGSVEVLAGLWPGEEVARDPSPLTDGRAVTNRR